jgi:hypothetical protein
MACVHVVFDLVIFHAGAFLDGVGRSIAEHAA